MAYEFTQTKIDSHIETFGIGPAAPIAPKDDRIHLQEFYNRASERFPELFETLAQGHRQFEIRKQISIPGKGNITATTFAIANGSPVFNVPHKLPVADDVFHWPNELSDSIRSCVRMLTQCLPTLKCMRVGKRREIVFVSNEEDPNAILKNRFAPNCPPEATDLLLRWNDADARYNRVIELQAVQKRTQVVQNVGGAPYARHEPTGERGIKLVLDVHNRIVAKPLDDDQIKIIWDSADDYYSARLLTILNGG